MNSTKPSGSMMAGKNTDATTMATSSTPFTGEVVQGGTVVYAVTGRRHTLALSDDFQVPAAPAPHWRVIDTMGNTYLFHRLVVEGGKYNKSITLPAYVSDVARVQIWCAFAEVVLGEARFDAMG